MIESGDIRGPAKLVGSSVCCDSKNGGCAGDAGRSVLCMDAVGGCSRAAMLATGGYAAEGTTSVVDVEEIRSERVGIDVVARKADRGKKCGPCSLPSKSLEAKGLDSHLEDSDS